MIRNGEKLNPWRWGLHDRRSYKYCEVKSFDFNPDMTVVISGMALFDALEIGQQDVLQLFPLTDSITTFQQLHSAIRCLYEVEIPLQN